MFRVLRYPILSCCLLLFPISPLAVTAQDPKIAALEKELARERAELKKALKAEADLRKELDKVSKELADERVELKKALRAEAELRKELEKVSKELADERIELKRALKAEADLRKELEKGGKGFEAERIELKRALKAEVTLRAELLAEREQARRAVARITALEEAAGKAAAFLKELEAEKARVRAIAARLIAAERELAKHRREHPEGGASMPLGGAARFLVEVPTTSARLYVDGSLYYPCGKLTREFVTQGLESGRRYAYTLRVVYERDGKEVTSTRQVIFTANTENRVSFRSDPGNK
jgi:uncharacterized protein (TIGR03000 family)